MLYLILLYPIPLWQIPFHHYTQFCYTWFSYGSFHLYVIPDSWTKLQCYTWFRYTSFHYNTSDFFVIHDSIIPNSVISVSSFLCYTRFGYAWFCYTRVRYDRFINPFGTSLTTCWWNKFINSIQKALFCGTGTSSKPMDQQYSWATDL